MINAHHEQLAALVRNGDLHIIAIIGTPRSGSTVATKALAQIYGVTKEGLLSEAAKAYLPEDKRRNVTDARVYEHFCGIILDAVRQKTEPRPTHIVVKNTSGRMSLDMFRMWMQLPSSFLFTFRDPATQFASFAKAFFAREFNAASSGMDIAAFLKETLPLASRIHPRFGSDIIDANKTRWQASLDELDLLRSACASSGPDHPQKYAFLESSLMRFDPHWAWMNVFARLGLDTNLVHPMIDQPWAVDISTEHKLLSPFKNRVSLSTGIQPLDEKERVESNQMPDLYQSHIADILPLYVSVLNAAIGTGAVPPLETLQNRACFGTATPLAGMNPLVARCARDLLSSASVPAPGTAPVMV